MRPDIQVAPRNLYEHNCPNCGGLHITAAEPLPADYFDEISRAFKDALKQIYSEKTPSDKMLITTGKTLAAQVRDAYGAVTTDFTTPDAEMLTRLTRDVWQFSAAKNYQELRDLTLLLKDENGKLREWEDFREAAQATGDKYNETWMRTEYDQAISGATSAARWAEFEQESDIIPNLQYQTVGDNAVRPEHALLNGIIKPLNDAFWNVNYPPNGWGCRCEAIQIPVGLGRVTPEKDTPTIKIAPMFRTNLAKTGLIFPKEHPYYNGIPRAELTKAMAYLPPQNTYVNFAKNPNIEINILHGDNEIEGNLRVTNAFTKNFNKPENPIGKVEFLPNFNQQDNALKSKYYPQNYTPRNINKNADAVIEFKNGEKWVVDYKYMQGNGLHLKDKITEAYQQADYAIIMFQNDIELSRGQVARKINNRMNALPDLKGVFVFDKNENLIWGVDR